MTRPGRVSGLALSVVLPIVLCAACLGEIERYPLESADAAPVLVSYYGYSRGCPYLLDATVSFAPDVGAELRVTASHVSRDPEYRPSAPVGVSGELSDEVPLADQPVDMEEFAQLCPKLSAMWEQGSQSWEVVERGWVEEFVAFDGTSSCYSR